uniref:Glycine N-acyltransferase-like protein n=1 Tax=Acrobeloides nanus TaxID=290746 RepID=A0A914CAR9_9BILA
MYASDTEITAFLHENPSGEQLWIIVRVNRFMLNYLIFGSQSGAKFEQKSLFSALNMLAGRFPELFYSNEPVIIQILHDFYENYYKAWLLLNFPRSIVELKQEDHLFYMDKIQQEILEDVDNKLSSDYYFDEKFSEEDLEKITFTWQFAEFSHVHHFRSSLSGLPFSLVRSKKNAELVGWALLDPSGYIRHHYVLPDHRQKGIGSAIEKDICKKCLKKNIAPYKTVEIDNPEAMEFSIKSKFWTRWFNNDGPVLVHFVKQVFRE